MPSLFETYELTTTLVDRPDGSLHQARDRNSNVLVLLQRPSSALSGDEGRSRLMRESGVLSQLASVPAVARVLGLVQGPSGGALVLQYFAGRPLSERARSPRRDLAQVLDGALALVSVVDGVHRAGFVHRNLHPDAFLVDDSGQVLLTGFGLATPAAEDRRLEGGTERVSDWNFLAPEQTGRIPAPIDYRTDYYALGMVLYTLLAGEPAFAVRSPLEAVHAHLAKIPAPLPECPAPLSEIVLKLLAKDPAQRYQSLTGLAADLNRCRTQWKQSGHIEPFALGSEDLADRLRWTRTLVGRDQELASLRQAYERTAQGSREVILIEGPSGVGKSVLAREAGGWALADGGFFLAGKWDEARKDQPYSAIVQQVEDLVRLLARRPDREAWKRTFATTLGDNQSVITALVPDFESLAGPLPPPPALPPRETENRFLYTFESFLRALRTSDGPVVLLFDDVQWIDPASVRLIEYLGAQRDTGRVLSIYSYRNNETNPSEVFPAFLARLEAESSQPALGLGPLEAPAVRAWIDGILGGQVAEPEALAKTLLAKTGGNPFFLAQWLRRIHREGLLAYDREAHRWTWNAQGLASLPASENVSDFLMGQFEALPSPAGTLLGIAACLGNTIQASDLLPFAESLPDLAVAVWPLVDQQYLVPLSDGYLALATADSQEGGLASMSFALRFQHDRIRQTARERLSPAVRADIHLKAARAIEATRPAEAVGHYLAVMDRLVKPEDRLHLTRLIVRVAEEARASSAARQALDLFRRAEGLAADAGLAAPEHQRLLLLLAETAYLCHEIDEGEATSNRLLSVTTDPAARAEVYQMQMDAFTFLGQMTDALERGQRAVAQLGLRLALQPNPLVLASTLIRVTGKAGRRTPDQLFLREGETPERVRMLLRLLGRFLIPAQMSGNVNLFVLSTLMTAELALTNPNSDETSGAFGNFAILLSVLGRHRQAYEFAGLALRLEEARPNPKTAAGVHSAYSFFSLPWNRPWAEVPAACRRGAAAALRAGDLFYIAYQNLFATVFSPSPVLETSIAALEETLVTIAGTRQDDALVGGTFALRRWQALGGQSSDPFNFSGPGFDEAAAVAGWEAKKNLSGLAVYHLYKGQVYFSLDRFEEAWKQWEAGQASASSIQGSAYMEEYAVYTALVCAERAWGGARRGPLLTTIAKERKRLASWAATSPENFAPLAALVRGEELALAGRLRSARRAFDEATRLAGSNASLHVRWRALILERAALHCFRAGGPVLGRYLMGDALRAYAQWGAKAKVRLLQKTYPGLVPESSGATRTGSALEGDAASLWKISQAVSREMDVDRLMTVVMQAVIENAGARRGWLLLQGDRGWQVVARGSSDGQAQAFGTEVSPESEGIPPSLLAAVESEEQGLLVSAAFRDPRFASDPLVATQLVKSVLALRFSPPGSQLRALWYVENDLVEGAFSADRLEGLRLLSGQIGISLENARIYRALTDLNRDLEGKVRDRTDELEERNRQFLSSVEYAGVLQRSLLPKDWGPTVAQHFALWLPKDIVGGDLYWFREGTDSCLLALVDCTGHGVPGALITVVVHAVLEEAWASAASGDLEAVLAKANQLFRRSLGQDGPGGESNDGFDIGLLWWPKGSGDLKYAGARLALIQSHQGAVSWFPGGRKGLGYRETATLPPVEVHTLPRLSGARYYLSSDGFLGQVGGDKDISFGRDRFAELLCQTADRLATEQAAALEAALNDYRGGRPQADDITVLGVELK